MSNCIALILELLLHNLWRVSVQQHNASTISVSSSDYNQFGRDFLEISNIAAVYLKQHGSLDISLVTFLTTTKQNSNGKFL